MRWYALLFTALFTLSTHADRPKVGLVLSGGGARGAAHVGVLKALEEMRIPVDVITGTSMGSIVGGLYASGKDADEIEEILNGMDWDYVLADDDSREDLSPNRKFQEDLFTVGFAPGFSEGQLKLPPGVIQGQKIELALQRFTTHVAHINDFNQLPVPFKAVATDIATGGRVILDKGNLGLAMRASMSVPSIFAPIEIDGQILVDGGIVDNLPVQLARDMGADILIVSDIGSPLRTREQLSNLLSVTDQLTRILTGRNVAASRAIVSANDILILPELGNITAAQFDRVGEAVPPGLTATREKAKELAKLKLTETDYQQYLASRPAIGRPSRHLRQVTVRNESPIGNEILEQRLDLKTDEPLDLDQLDRDIGQIHGIGTFEKVGYDIAQHQNGVDLEIYATPKSWGPNYLHFGVKADGDLSGDNGTNLILGYSRSAINSRAGEWTTLLQIGEEPKLLSYLHQPLGINLDFFAQPSLTVERKNINIFEDGDKLAEYRLEQTQLEMLIGREFATRAVLGLGINAIRGEANVLIGDSSLPETDFDDGGLILKFRYDTLDDIDYPTRGAVARASYYHALDSLGADEEYQQWQLRTYKFASFGQHTLGIGANFGGTEDAPASLARRFLLGGFLNMSGLQLNEMSGEYKGLVQATYYRRFEQIKFLPAYIGGSLEYGGVWQERDDISHDNSLFGGSLFLGLDSPLGPMLLGWGYTDDGDQVFFTKIGRFFN
jgi:NTE family protein